MSKLHIFFECGAIGDQTLNLYRAATAMDAEGHDKVVVHYATEFRYAEKRVTTKCNPDALAIWQRTKFIERCIPDIKYDDPDTFLRSKWLNVPIERPMLCRSYNQIKDWLDLKEFTPKLPDDKPVALFHPVSIKFKQNMVSPEDLEGCFPVWRRCLTLLIEKGYRVVMVGGPDDPWRRVVPPDLLPKIDNKIGKWKQLEAVAALLYKADVILACDS
jgi:hypothetical protein